MPSYLHKPSIVVTEMNAKSGHIRRRGLESVYMARRTADALLRRNGMRIEQLRFGEITVGGERFAADVLLLGDRVRPHWWRKEGHLLQLEDLTEVLADHPEVLIVGTGLQECMKIAPEVVAHTKEAGIELLAFDTRTACQSYNYLHGKRRIAAAIHLTC
jgi:hypothetical protein